MADRSRAATFVWLAESLALAGLLACAIAAHGDATIAAQDRAPRPTLGQPSLNEIDSRQRSELARLDAYLSNRQWAEAVDALERIAAAGGERLMADVASSQAPGFDRYITAADACQARIAAWRKAAPEALAIYRRRVDPRAQEWWNRATGITANRPVEGNPSLADYAGAPDGEGLLRRIASELFASSYGDQALDRLAQLALDRGDYDAARRYWKATSPAFGARGLVYPDTDLNLAQISSCLALVSILQGDDERAGREIEIVERRFPKEAGHLAGRDGELVDILNRLREESRQWKASRPASNWPTFAGDFERNGRATGRLDPRGTPLWSVALTSNHSQFYPIVVGDAAVVYDGRYLRALNLHSGAPWPEGTGEVAAIDLPSGAFFDAGESPMASGDSLSAIGHPRYTLSSDGRRIFVRLGGPVFQRTPSTPSTSPVARATSSLAAFDLPTQRLLFRIEPESAAWEFEGSPACRGDSIYVAMRRTDQVQPQMFVAAYDAQSGELRWRSHRICSAASPGAPRGEWPQALVTLHEDRLYLSTDLGAIAALDATTGRIVWVTTYPRVAPNPAENSSPCLYDNGLVFAAPADADRVFALDADSGHLVWRTRPGQTGNARQLLGVGAERLIVSGDRLFWFDSATGQPRGQFPAPSLDGPGIARMSPRGVGRGLLAGDKVFFPAAEAIYVFEQATMRTPAGWLPRGAAEIDLSSRGVSTAAHLVAANGVLLITTPDALTAFQSPIDTTSAPLDRHARQ